jgi:iron complex transport system permease protein
LLPISALGGAVLLPLADLFVRISPTGAELRLGVVTALVGAPFFLMLLLDLRRARP